jgi:hypothetical protein
MRQVWGGETGIFHVRYLSKIEFLPAFYPNYIIWTSKISICEAGATGAHL